MSKFIKGKELEEAVYNIIWDANKDLLIVSPYIKLGEYFKKLFEKHVANPKLHIIIVFGKNEGQVNKSFNKADLEYFKQFLNISIVYVPNLHAKYYANDGMGVLTSINLYDYSFVNNIEFGVLYENNFLNRLAKNTDNEAWETCWEVANNNEVIFVKRPVFEKKLIGKNYINSRVLLDRTEELYNGTGALPKRKKKVSDFEEYLDYSTQYNERPNREDVQPDSNLTHNKTKSSSPVYNTPMPKVAQNFEPGYCIRTGVKIQFDMERPMSYQAYQSWSKFSNPDYPEKYCHFSGEPSNGTTSVNRPVLGKNWRKSQNA